MPVYCAEWQIPYIFYFNRRHPVVFLILEIIWFLSHFYNESTFITVSKHLHNVLDTLHPVQQCFKLRKKGTKLFIRTPCNSMGNHNV